MNSFTSAACPSLSNAVDVKEPSRIHDREYERDPGWIAGPSRFIRMSASWVRIVSVYRDADGGSVMPTRPSFSRHSD